MTYGKMSHATFLPYDMSRTDPKSLMLLSTLQLVSAASVGSVNVLAENVPSHTYACEAAAQPFVKAAMTKRWRQAGPPSVNVGTLKDIDWEEVDAIDANVEPASDADARLEEAMTTAIAAAEVYI